MTKKLIVANWKMNPESLAEAEEILEFVNDYLESLAENKELSLVFCPPFVFLEEASRILATSHLEHDAFLGAQDISIEDKAALTGEVSGPMLKRLGVRYVIIGHSERRWKLGESDTTVNKKLKSALRNELIPIVCIGERSREGDFKGFLKDQIKNTFKELSADEISKCIVAYEPVWAISTNVGAKPDTPASALESIRIIKDFLIGNWTRLPDGQELEIGNLPKVLYGGSVNSANTKDFLSQEDIDGVLVGGASIKKQEFVKILDIASKI